MASKNPGSPCRATQASAFRVLANLVGAIAAALGLLAPFPASARYVPDTSTAPDGVIDISIHGDAAIAPSAVYASISGNEFITVAQRDTSLAVCAFTTAAKLQDTFGSGGCYRDTLGATENVYQLLVGKSGYWLFIADSGNAKRFSLLRLTSLGQPDAGYGPFGRRSFDLVCDATDVAPRCPQVRSLAAQQSAYAAPVMAETSDFNLWVLAARKTSNNADEGVLFHLDQGLTITGRANLYDGMPPSWIPGMQQFASMPIGVVAHGDGALVEHRTNYGYALIRVGANGAVDHGFASTQSNGIIVAGDAALPVSFFQMPVVATDNTFLWGFTATGARTRYDRFGASLGTLAIPGYVFGAPDSFIGASTALWISDGTRIGRWQNGQWDNAVFGGQGPFQPTPSQTFFAVTRDTGSLAMLNAPTGTSTSIAPVLLTIVATQSIPQPLVAPFILQADAVLSAEGTWTGLDSGSFGRYATQVDGKTIWQHIVVDPLGTKPGVATGALEALMAGTRGIPIVSGVNAAGARWAVRTIASDVSRPNEFYADLAGAGQPPRRINMDAIRAEMPAFSPMAPYANPLVWSVDTTADGSAQALLTYASGTSSAYVIRLALLRWNSNSVAANEYVPQIDWRFDLGTGSIISTSIQRDAQGRLLLNDLTNKRIRRLSQQGGLDPTFGQGGTIELSALGFVSSDFSATTTRVKSLADGGAWVGTGSRVVRINADGQQVAQVIPVAHAPYNYSSVEMVFSQFLADSDGSLLVVSTPRSQPKTYRLLRYTPAGVLDTQYGLRGAETLVVNSTSYGITLLPLAGHGMAAVADNAIRLFRYDATQPGPTGNTVPVIEFYNTTLDHYFMTADTAEIAGIEAGAAGPGWTRTGQQFRAYANLIDAPGDALPVCRFYGSAEPLARSPNGRTGPNSHFYTFAGQECDNVYNFDKAWQYEGPRLALVPLLADMSCAPGQTPILRAYNNGYEVRNGVWTKNDSNHRYATSQAIISDMVNKGWVDEGRRFCAPN